jgi:hypothetical protein
LAKQLAILTQNIAKSADIDKNNNKGFFNKTVVKISKKVLINIELLFLV